MKKTSLTLLRRILILTAAFLLIASFAGCQKKGEGDGPEPTPTQTTPVEPQESEAPTDPPAQSPTDAPAQSVMGTVIANNLNVRSNASTDSTVLKQLAINTRVEILEQKTEGTTVWGRIADGWINMHYVQVDGETPVDPTDPPADDPADTPVTGEGSMGTISATELYIRKGAAATYDSVGSYKKGDRVEILETKNGWGRTDKGWISMKYVALDSTGNNTGDDKTPSAEIVSDGKTAVLGYGVVDIGSLNVRSGPGTKYEKIDTVSSGSRYAYYQKSGNWVRIKTGWVSTSYFYLEGTKVSTTTGTVTADGLNARTGPGTDFKSNGSYNKGDKVEILHQIGNWGYTSKGWISMKYVDTGDKTSASTGTGTVNATELHIRKEASRDSESLGVYKNGEKITILEVRNGWGKTDKGWVSMDYVKMNDESTTYKTGKGTVNATELHIRKEASKDSESIGTYKNGDKVEIKEVKKEWGKTDKGWISLKYVKMDG